MWHAEPEWRPVFMQYQNKGDNLKETKNASLLLFLYINIYKYLLSSGNFDTHRIGFFLLVLREAFPWFSLVFIWYWIEFAKKKNEKKEWFYLHISSEHSSITILIIISNEFEELSHTTFKRFFSSFLLSWFLFFAVALFFLECRIIDWVTWMRIIKIKSWNVL